MNYFNRPCVAVLEGKKTKPMTRQQAFHLVKENACNGLYNSRVYYYHEKEVLWDLLFKME